MSSYGVATPGPGTTVEAVVKWFNLTKGFGFVAPADGSADAFLHMSVLDRAGMQQIAENTKLLVEIGNGQKGRQVVRIIQVLSRPDNTSSNTAPRSAASAPSSHAPSSGVLEELVGAVKWFKDDKGFGFVTPDDGGKDVFVHKTVLLNAGVSRVETGQKLKMKVQTASKGREAVEITLI